ncbi:hypothetical protein PR002_g25306 [Phytophthora rubi]|uniref:Chromo domain-containing protein n=2 Tax=Phytophthora rubi TaxID=129364 RepID=A0A6A3I8W1_9STRA|nr:hypothetical protein PR002_g25306 [Phytophthora rubi]
MMGATSDSEEGRKEVEEPIPEAAPSDPTPGGTTAEVATQLEDEQVCYHEGGDLRAEEVESGMAVLPEVTQSTEDVTIEDIQVGDPTVNSAEEINRLRQLIWRRRHLLIGKGNALPPAARGIVCDIDVGGAKPIAQRVRKVAPQFREKLSDLIKGLLGARIINMSTSPWASPIVVIIKKNGVDIRLCIDYRLVNSLTRLMIYPMPLINDLLEDLDKVLWYCSLDMASGFWVVTMTDRARAISAFITPFGLFEWNRMPFGLKNAPQIYQRMLNNALYGFTRIPRLEGDPARKQPDPETSPDLIPSEPKDDGKKSVLGRRSYIDDILITAESWDHLCNRVEGLLDVCDEWNLSISVVKSFWGKDRVEYLGHKVSSHGLEANPKDLSALTDLPFPGSLRAMQSFLGSLNYYSKFIEDYAIYAAVLYELREVNFAAMSKPETRSRIQNLAAAVGGDREETGKSAEADLRWIRAQKSFSKLKEKVASTPILCHFKPDLQRETAGTEYRLFPVVHISKLKLVRTFPDRPTARLLDERSERVDLDEALLPEDSWTRDLDEYEYEVEKIADMRTGKRTRYGRIYREFLVHWRGYEDPTWVDEADLNCGALLHEFLRDHTSRNRFGVMQSHEE